MADKSAIALLYEENRNLYQKNMDLQERLLSLTEQNADLRIQAEISDMSEFFEGKYKSNLLKILLSKKKKLLTCQKSSARPLIKQKGVRTCNML